jgi:hypothetical protein
VPPLSEHLGNDREESRFGLAASRGRENDEVRPREKRINGQRLHVSQFPPPQGIDDVVLKCRVQSRKCGHGSSSMSSTLWACDSRSTGVNSLLLIVNW